MTDAEFRAAIAANANNVALLARLADSGLPDCYLTAGCLFQTVWNLRDGREPTWGIKDYDIFYFDPSDLTAEAEVEVERRVRAAFADLPIKLDIKNQARVHLWYEAKFGAPYPKLRSSTDGIDRYLVACTCIGIEVSTQHLHAPDGLDDLTAGRLRINPVNARPGKFREKARSYQERWNWLEIID
jgi:uncharacterized protein